jgi:hypothetical protein
MEVRNQWIVKCKVVVVNNAMTGPEREFSRDYDDYIEKLESIGTVLV